MDGLDENFKFLVRKCLERRMSIDTVLQVLNLSEFPNWNEISTDLMQDIDTISERALREKISYIIKH